MGGVTHDPRGPPNTDTLVLLTIKVISSSYAICLNITLAIMCCPFALINL